MFRFVLQGSYNEKQKPVTKVRHWVDISQIGTLSGVVCVLPAADLDQVCSIIKTLQGQSCLEKKQDTALEARIPLIYNMVGITSSATEKLLCCVNKESRHVYEAVPPWDEDHWLNVPMKDWVVLGREDSVSSFLLLFCN